MTKYYYIIMFAAALGLTSCSGNGSKISANETVESVAIDNSDSIDVVLSPAELEQIKGLAEGISPDIREKFDSLHTAWYDAAANTPEITLSSRSDDWMKLPQFAQLVEMGDDVLPLVVEKMVGDEGMFTVHVYEAIQPDEALKAKSEGVLQNRAKRSAKLWLATQVVH